MKRNHRRIVIVVLVLAGLTLVGHGLCRWLDHQAAVAVVDDFFDALREGDRQRLLSRLTPQRRKEVEQSKEALARFDVPTPSFRWRIQQLTIRGDRAEARLLLEKNGYVLEPVVFLHRVKTFSWKIDRFDHLQVDPLWLKQRQARLREGDKAIARKLQKALENRPGISVQRLETPPADDSRTLSTPSP